MLDVRKPIGLLFAIYGLILIFSGFVHPTLTKIAEHNFSFNLNLVWGGLMGIFGVVMLLLASAEKKK